MGCLLCDRDKTQVRLLYMAQTMSALAQILQSFTYTSPCVHFTTDVSALLDIRCTGAVIPGGGSVPAAPVQPGARACCAAGPSRSGRLPWRAAHRPLAAPSPPLATPGRSAAAPPPAPLPRSAVPAVGLLLGGELATPPRDVSAGCRCGSQLCAPPARLSPDREGRRAAARGAEASAGAPEGDRWAAQLMGGAGRFGGPRPVAQRRPLAGGKQRPPAAAAVPLVLAGAAGQPGRRLQSEASRLSGLAKFQSRYCVSRPQPPVRGWLQLVPAALSAVGSTGSVAVPAPSVV
ncbi:nematocyst expressed protein 3-like [Schistocerca piceifrons]|uniref:nematocyst expressed protein 3-like n=1 Tax=Schistocerca piceifrons TaxID=274613 RepID=UPI001F5E5945|nr:nematocyst expressed protein 3-like [Schistocerca piceifrons]